MHAVISTVVGRRRLAALAAVALMLALGPVAAQAQVEPRGINNACPPGDIPPAGFTDIAGNPHEAAIHCLAHYRITAGTTETTYSPGLNVRRDQMASFIARFLELFIDLPADPPDQFTDVTAGNPHRLRINQLAQLGVVGGFGDGTYQPGATVLRDQMASFINRALSQLLEAPLSSGQDFFTDDNGNPHEENINALAEVGIVAGVGANQYAPRTGVRRDQMASFIMRATDFAVVDGGFGDVFTSAFLVLLTGWAEVATGPTGASFAQGETDNIGFASIRLNSSTGRVCYFLVTFREDRTYSAAHIHAGAMDETGDVVIPLEAPDPELGFADACTDEDPDLVAAVEDDASNHYVNLHSEEFPDGALRGQLAVEVMLSYMSWAFEVEETEEGDIRFGAGEPGGDGVSFLQLDPAGGRVCAYFETDGVTMPYVGAHIHEGTLMENGDIVVDFSVGLGVQPVSDCQEVEEALLQDLIENRDNYYTNIHNMPFPAGAVRTQLDSAALTVPLSAEEEPDGGEEGATGDWIVQATFSGDLCYYLETDATGPFTGAHIHEGERGVDGPIVVNLELPAEPDDEVGEDGVAAFSQCLIVDPDEVFDLDLDTHYVNVHTEDHPGGAVRGQLADGIVRIFDFEADEEENGASGQENGGNGPYTLHKL